MNQVQSKQIEKPAEKPARKGIVFSHRIKSYSDAGPQYFDDIRQMNQKLRDNRELWPRGEFVGIEYPVGSGKALVLTENTLIEDRRVARWLIANVARPRGSLAMDKPGVIYSPEEAVEAGFISAEEARAGRLAKVDIPKKPAVQYEMATNDLLDQYAFEAGIQWDPSWARNRKISSLKEHESRAREGE